MGDISRWVKGATIGAMAAACALLLAAPAEAGIAKTGSVYPISYLTLPPGAVAGASSGISGPGTVQSPISGDGRFVLFTSLSDNLAPDTDKDQANLFRKDTQTGDVIMVSRQPGKSGAAAGGYIYSSAISANGKLAIFLTDAQVTPDDTDDQSDIYLRDIPAGTTTLLTPGTTKGIQSADLSSDGRFVTYSTGESLAPGDGNTTDDVYRQKIDDGSIDLVSRVPAAPTAGNDHSYQPTISADGRWVAFASRATDLVTGFVDNNGTYGNDVFIRDMDGGGSTYLASSRFNSATQGGNDGSDEPDLAGNAGSIAAARVAYTSYATDLADNGVTDPNSDASVYYKSMSGMASELISRASGPGGVNADSRAHTPSLSADGKRVIFTTDATNLGAPPDYYGVYLRDRTSSGTSLVSARTQYAVAGVISGDGKLGSWAESGGATNDSDPDLSSVFARSLPSGKISLISRPKGTAKVVAPGFYTDFNDEQRIVSGNGRYVVFATSSSRLPGGSPEASQIYRRDLKTGKIELVSRASGAGGTVAEGASLPSISEDGNLIAFNTWSKLDAADTNTDSDSYVRNMTTQETNLVSRADGPAGAVASEGAGNPVISGNGRSVAFVSSSSNLGIPGGTDQVYVRNLASDQTIVGSRADGVAGAVANGTSSGPMLSDDGKLLIFNSYGTNLDPDDPANSQSLYLRDLGANTTDLLSRAPGLAGASLSTFVSGGVISGDGSRVAFVARDDSAVPATAPWPVGPGQIVVRDIADGANQLASQTPGGQVGAGSSASPSLSRDGSIVAFETESTDIRPEIEYTDLSTVVVRDLTDGTVDGPPSFGAANSLARGSETPFVSCDGNCVVFTALGHNQVSGDLGDMPSAYVYARGGCLDPLAIAPKLSAVKLKPAKFRVAKKATAKVSRKAPKGTKIRFKLNTGATVTFTFERRKKVRKKVKFVKTGKLVRRDLAAGANLLKFSGRIGRRALKPGRYRVKLRATNETGSSKTVAKAFRVVRR